MTGLITVRSALSNPKRVAIWENDPRHPNGEAFVTGRKGAVEVYRTAEVDRRIKGGLLTVDAVTVEAAAAPSASTQHPATAVDGIGPATAKKLKAAGVTTVADLLAADLEQLAADTELTIDRLEEWQGLAKEL